MLKHLTTQTLNLSSQLQTQRLFIIHGEQSSDKSTVLNILKEAIDQIIKALMETKKVSKLTPLVICEIYHSSDSKN